MLIEIILRRKSFRRKNILNDNAANHSNTLKRSILLLTGYFCACPVTSPNLKRGQAHQMLFVVDVLKGCYPLGNSEK